MRAKDLSRLQPALDRKTLKDSKRASLEATITPDLADRLGKSYILGRFTSPEIAASAAVAGITNLEDLHTNVATQLLKQGIVPQRQLARDNPVASYANFLNAQEGEIVTIPDPKTGKPITVTIDNRRPTAAFTQGEVRDPNTGKVVIPSAPAVGLRKRTEAEVLAQEKAQRELQQRVPVVDIDKRPFTLAATQGPSSFTAPSSAGEAIALPFKVIGVPFSFAGSAISMMSPDQLKFVGTGVRAAVKTVVAAGMTAGETTYNTARLTLRDAYAAGQTDASPWERFKMAADPRKFVNNLGASFVSSTGITALTDLFSGDLDTGGGFLIQGKTGERAQELQNDMAGTVAEAMGIDPNKYYIAPEDKAFYDKPFDTGFIAGEALVDAKLTSRDSELYQFVEDFTNVFLRIGLDPGIAGFDVTDIALRGLTTKFNLSNQVAKSYLNARQAGEYEEALRIAVENGMDAKQAELLADTERLTKLAEDLVTPKENVVYSGDRGFKATDEPTKFQDVDAPGFMPNTENYLSEGLYVTDGIYPATSIGYNAVDIRNRVTGLDTVTTPYGPIILGNKGKILSDAGLVPEGVDLNNVALNPEGNVAGVWKFDKTDLNIIEFNDYVDKSPDVFNIILDSAQKAVDENMMPHHRFDPVATQDAIDSIAIFDRFESSVQSFNSIRKKAQDVIDANGSIKLFPDGIAIEFTNVEDYINWLKERPNYIKHLQRSEPLREILVKKYGFSEEDASIIASDLIGMTTARSGINGSLIVDTTKLIEKYKENPMYGPVGAMFREIVKSVKNLYLVKYAPSPYQLAEMDMAQALSYVSGSASGQSMANFQNTINGSVDAANEVLAAMLKPFYDESTIQEILQTRKNYDPNAREAITQQGMTQVNPVTRALVDAGYDGMRYNGGSVIGGTGTHNAYVVWKPSKMQHLDVMSGERFPINQLVENLTEANRLGYTADEIANLKGVEDGWKQGMGLIGMDPKMVEPTAINNMRNTPFGQRLLQAMADETSVVKIWRDFLKEKSPGAAIRLAKASTPDEVFEVLREVVDSGDPNVNLRNLPNGWKDWTSSTGFKVKQRLDRYTKQTAMMPESTYISFDDPVSALQRTDRLMQIVGVKGPERDRVLEVLFKAIDEDTSVAWDNFFAAANETTLTNKMIKAGWTPEQIQEFTSYRRKGDMVQRFTLEDLADNIPIEWFDEGDGPLRITQLLAGGGWLLEPEVIDELIRDLNPVIRGLRKITKDHPAIAKTIGVERTITRALETASSAWVKPAALGAPLPFRYVMRVVPEETLRVAFSGEFDNLGQYMAQIFTGHLNTDTFGRTIRSSQQVAEEMAKLQHLKDEYEMLQQQLTTAPSLAQKTQKRINAIEKKYGTEAEMQARIDELTLQIDDNIVGDQRALVNRVRGHLEGTHDDNTLNSYMQRSDIPQVVTNEVIDPLNITTKEKKMRRNWVKAQAQDIAEMAANRDYRVIAGALLAGDPAMLERIAQDLLSGDLRGTYEAYTKNVFNTKLMWDWETIEAARSRVNEIVIDIKQRTALHPEILDALSKDKYGGAPLRKPTINKVYEADPLFRKLVRDVLLDNPAAPRQVEYYPLVRSQPRATRNANFMYASFGMYTKASAAMARNPLWGQAYWKRIIEMMPAMDSSEAAAMVAANVDKLPDYTLEKLQDALPSAKGELTRTEVSRVAEVHAREVTDGLLYNAQNNKSYVAYRHPLFFMFFDAYREQWMTWLKLMKNPANIHKVDVASRSLQSFREPFSEEDNTILHNDPTTNKQTITVPFSRWMLGLAGGDANFAIPTRNLSFVGSVAPGVGPVVSLAAASWYPQSETWANMKQTFMPFAGANSDMDWRQYFLPQFVQLAATGIAGKGSDKVPSLDVVWGALEKFASNDVEQTKKTASIHIMRQLAGQIDKYPLTPEGRKQLLEDVDSLSDNFAIARAFARTFLPAAPITQYYVDTKQGNILQGLLLDEIRKTENEVFAKGGNLSQAVTTLFTEWGPGIWAFFGSGSQTHIPGLQPTKEYQSWVFDNKGLLGKYPMAGGYLGPQLGEYNARIFTQQVLLGQRSRKDPKVSLEDAANIMAESYYDYRVSSISPEDEGTDEARRAIEGFKTETEQKFPTWSPLLSTAEAQVKRRLQMQEIRKMIKDPKIVDSSGGFALKQYMLMRDAAIEKMIDAEPTVTERNWNTVEASYSLRKHLFDKGTLMAKETPEFGALWQNILKREFKTDDIVPTVEASE